jgi:hypothetical protein
MTTFVCVLVPCGQARKGTRHTFRRTGRFLRIGEGNLPWRCARCGETVAPPELTLDYRTFPGLPVCPTTHCPGAGWEDIDPTA